uniref:DNA-directed RNA polymerase n=1 Tax=Opuntia streptacantha TaxID=393608 RepID=A0A7C9AID8_OPUST
MDLDDLDEPTQAPAKPSRFAPKSKFQPKSKQPPKPKSEAPVPKPEPPPTQDAAPPAPMVVVKKEEEFQSQSLSSAVMDVDGDADGEPSAAAEPKQEEREMFQMNGDGMEVEEVVEEDYVIAEYDVYFSPSDSDTQLYVLQYPMRPSWRPYELDQRCAEVRVKPNSAELEVDLSIDMDSDNYNPDAASAAKMKHETLSSEWVPPQVTGYAVGVLMGKKLCSFVRQWNI